MKKIMIITAVVALAVIGCGNKLRKPDNKIKVGKGPDALFVTPNQKYLYVANVQDKYVSVIDTQTEKVITTIDTVDYPWGFSRLQSSNLVAVSGYDKGLDLVDFTSHKVVKSVKFSFYVGGLDSTEDGRYIYIVSISENKVKKLDSKTFKVLKEYDVGKGPDGIGLGYQDKSIYVTNTKDKTVSIINIATGQQQVLKLGGKPELIHSNHDSSRLYISNHFANKVHIFDTTKGKILKNLENIANPEEAVLSRDEKILYAVSYKKNLIYAFNAKTLERLPYSYQTGKKPIGIIEANQKIFVSNFGDNAITVYHNILLFRK